MSLLANLLVRITGDSSNLETSLDRANRKSRTFANDVKKTLGPQLAAALSFTAIAAGINKAFQAADALDASNRKLAATAKITGQNLGFLQTTAQKANDQFKLGATLSNEFAIEMTKLASKAGQIEKVNEGIAAFLNLGAGKGLGAAETLQAVQQAILGIDEGTDKLFGKNPSAIYEEFARSVGLVASKMTDSEKALAIFNAGLNDGGKLAQEYAKFLQSPAGQAEQLRIKTEEMAASIGRSLNAVRMVVLPILAEMTDGIRRFVAWVQHMGVETAVVVAKLKVAWARFRDLQSEQVAADFNITGPNVGTTGGNVAKAEAELRRVQEAAKNVHAEIDRNMSLAMQITGPTNPLAQVFNQVTTAAEEAESAIERLDKRIGFAARDRSLGGPALALMGSAFQRFQSGLPSPATGTVTARGSHVLGQSSAPSGNQGFFGQFFGGLKEQVTSLAASFGPLAVAAAVLRPAFEGLMEAVGPALQALAIPLRYVGELLGGVLAKGLSYVAQAIGWFIKAIGTLVDKLVPDWISKVGKNLAAMGQEMIDNARAVRNATDATEKFAASLTNVPTIFSVERVRHNLGSNGYSLGPNGPMPNSSSGVTVVFNGPVYNPSEIARAVEDATRRISSRGASVYLAPV